ncbi:MAG: TM1812 family CRISPR-associated protein [Thermoproteota archaeon]
MAHSGLEDTLTYVRKQNGKVLLCYPKRAAGYFQGLLQGPLSRQEVEHSP